MLTTDFCPWANRFVYGLKEPIGWFVLATIISVMIGMYLSPVGWTLAASLVAIMSVGMIWPWIAIRVTTCTLGPETDCISEDDTCRMIVSVRNRVPVPVWGLAVTGYFDCQHDEASPTAGLACVPPFCISDFGITVHPSLRGRYPIQTPMVSCSFPFGIWTARRKMPTAKPLVVWPKVFAVFGTCPFIGTAHADHGEGDRGGRSGDFVGVRAYRRGDSARHIHWVASARTDSMMVTERGAPQCVPVNVRIDTHRDGTREQLADRIRIAASVMINLHQSHVPMRVTVGSRPLRLASGSKGKRQILDAMTDIPVDGESPIASADVMTKQAEIRFSSDRSGNTIVNMVDPRGGRRAGGRRVTIEFSSDRDLADQISHFWSEVQNDGIAA